MPTKPKKKTAAKLKVHQPSEPRLFTLEVCLLAGRARCHEDRTKYHYEELLHSGA